MWETLESRRMMSVSTITQEPVVTTTPTTTIDMTPEEAASRLFTSLSNAFGAVIKSIGDAAQDAARHQ